MAYTNVYNGNDLFILWLVNDETNNVDLDTMSSGFIFGGQKGIKQEAIFTQENRCLPLVSNENYAIFKVTSEFVWQKTFALAINQYVKC